MTLAMEALLDGESEALTRKAIELALGGDITETSQKASFRRPKMTCIFE